jgi:hypothetical protein
VLGSDDSLAPLGDAAPDVVTLPATDERPTVFVPPDPANVKPQPFGSRGEQQIATYPALRGITGAAQTRIPNRREAGRSTRTSRSD